MNIVYLCIFIRVPELKACQVYNHKLVDEKLKSTYKRIPRLPRYLKLFRFIFALITFSIRMADFAPAYGLRCDRGGFQFSEVLPYYQSTDVEYVHCPFSFNISGIIVLRAGT